jgi:hypothetical protein
LNQTVDRLDHVADGTHRFEFFGGDFLAGLAFDVIDQVDCIDAVDFQILIQVGPQTDALGFQLEEFDQSIAQGVENIGSPNRVPGRLPSPGPGLRRTASGCRRCRRR